MSRQAVAVAAVACLMLVVSPGVVAEAGAQERATEQGLTFVAPSAFPVWQYAVRTETPLPPAEVGQSRSLAAPIVQPYRRIESGKSPLLMSLYVTTAITQALDIHSTLKALDRGGVEMNPLLSGLTGNKAAFIAVKSAVAAGSILAARRLAKRNKVAAIISMVAINAAYGLVAHHNYKVAGRLR
jgi:hypothetical protein